MTDPVPPHPTIWTDEALDLLRRRWAEGTVSAQAIADELGPAFTRNAVIGKAHRLKLPGHGKSSGRPPKVPAAAGPPVAGEQTAAPVPIVPKPIRSVRTGLKTTYEPPPPIKSVIEPPPADPVFIIDLRPFQCRFPVVEIARDVYCYCARPTVGTSSWCREHYAKCFVKPGVRRTA